MTAPTENETRCAIARLLPIDRAACGSGLLCPVCMEYNDGTRIKCVGSNPDGLNMNRAYDCVCGAKWEGN